MCYLDYTLLYKESNPLYYTMIKHIKLLLSEEDFVRLTKAKEKTKSRSWEKFVIELLNKSGDEN